MSEPIRDITDLRIEIARLQAVRVEQEIVLKAHFSSPSAIFHTVRDAFASSRDKDAKRGSFNADELIGMASRFIIPFALNRTIFRKSNFIIKALVGLVSQRASGFVNEKSLTSTWDKVKGVTSKIKGLIPEKWIGKKEQTLDTEPIKRVKIAQVTLTPPPPM